MNTWDVGRISWMCANKVRFFYKMAATWSLGGSAAMSDWLGVEVYRLAAKCPNNHFALQCDAIHTTRQIILQHNAVQWAELDPCVNVFLCKCTNDHFPLVCHQVWISSSCAILCSHVHSICAKICTALDISFRYNAVKQCALNYISVCALSLNFLDSEQSRKDQ